MFITKIELTHPPYNRRGRNDRCQHKAKGGAPSSNGICSRFATYKMNNGVYCNQHAGKVALEYLINDDKKERRYLNIEGMK